MNKYKGKTAVIYHGYAAEDWRFAVDYNRIDYLEYLGFDNVMCDSIDYDGEWEYDGCKSMLNWQLKKIQNVDLIIGFSLGGYTAYALAGYLPKANLIMVNPSIDRDLTKLDIKWYNFPQRTNFGEIELYLGQEDTLIDMNVTLNYLRRNRIKFKHYIIPGMDHGTPMKYFARILHMSKFTK